MQRTTDGLGRHPVASRSWKAGLAPAVLALFLLCTPTHGGTVYHVSVEGSDDNPGTADAPLATIQHAISQVGPGDTVRLGPGTFQERISFLRSNSGQEGAPVVLEGTLDEDGTRLSRIDGGDRVDPRSWQPAPDFGPSVYQNTSFPYEPAQMLIDGSFLAHMDRSAGNAMEVLAWPEDHAIATEFLKLKIPFWETLGGIFAHHPDPGKETTYLRLAGGADPRDHTVAITPAEAVITINHASHIIIRNLEVASGDTGILVRGHRSSHNNIENCFIVNGRKRIHITLGAQNTTIRNCEIIMGFHGHDTGAWHGGKTKRHAKQEYIYHHFKYGHSRGAIEDDSAIWVGRGTENTLIENNRLKDGVLGIASRDTSGLIVRNNTISNYSNVGVMPRDATSMQCYDNHLSNNSINIRLHRINTGGPFEVYIYRNRLSLPMDAGWHIFSHSRWGEKGYTPPKATLYHNTFRGGDAGFSMPDHRNMPEGVPGFRLINNLFDSDRSLRRTELTRPEAMGVFDYNWIGGRQPDPMPQWVGPDNIVAEGERIGTEPDVFTLPEGHQARNAGIDLSQPFTIDGQTHEPLPGLDPGYFSGSRPDMGALQH